MNKLTNPMKRMLREMVGQTCELCGKKEEEVGALEINLINKAIGLIPSNIHMLCANCKQKDI